MKNNDWKNNHYTKKARDAGLVARSYYKLEEIDLKYHLMQHQPQIALDLGCAPGSWLQYLITKDIPTILGFDIKKTLVSHPSITSYQYDLTDRELIDTTMQSHAIQPGSVELIVSDMAPDTIGMSDIDALRSVTLIEKTLWMYEKYLHPEHGKFAIKVFMGPGYDELVRDLREIYGRSNIVIFKPKSCRKKSKETFIVKRG